jgi:hypothetical protein
MPDQTGSLPPVKLLIRIAELKRITRICQAKRRADRRNPYRPSLLLTEFDRWSKWIENSLFSQAL